MKKCLIILFVIILLGAMGCQQEPATSFPEMKGAWTSLDSGNLKEIRHLSYIAKNNLVLASGIPLDGHSGLQYFLLENGTWSPPSENVPTNHSFTMTFKANDVVYGLMFANAESPGQIRVSQDSGETWNQTLVLPELTDPRSLAVTGENRDVLLLGTVNRGVFLSDDGGISWRKPERVPDNPGIQGFAVNPENPNHVLVATRVGVFESNDAGETWQPITNRFSMNPVFVVEVKAHPERSDCFTCIYRSAAGAATVIRSTDRGQTWQTIETGLYDDAQPRCIVFHPTNPAVAYIGTVYDGVYKTESLGDQWYPINNGLPIDDPIIIHDLIFAGAQKNVLLAGTNVDGQLFQLTDY